MAVKPTKKIKKIVAKKPAPKAAAKKSGPKAKAASRLPAKAPKPAVRARSTAATGDKPAKVRQVTKPRSATGSFTQSEFVESLRAFCGLAKRSEAKELVEDVQLLVKEALRKGYKIPMFGLGKLYVRNSKARVGKNPKTGESINIPARKRVRFAAAKALKEHVL